MINTKKELKDFISKDFKANDYSKRKRFFEFLAGGGVYSFLKVLRRLEYAINSNKKWKWILLLRHRRMLRKFNCEIYPNNFGPGLRIEHLNGIIINGKARIGAFCNIHQFVTIGNNGLIDEAPTIGDNCYIGCNVSIIGPIIIGNNVTIGAGSVVNHCFEDNTKIAGVPAKEICTNK